MSRKEISMATLLLSLLIRPAPEVSSEDTTRKGHAGSLLFIRRVVP
jgi:hypothetical protein